MPPGGNPGIDPALQSAELFDPDTLTFSSTGPIGTPTGGGPMVTLPDGRIFMATDRQSAPFGWPMSSLSTRSSTG